MPVNFLTEEQRSRYGRFNADPDEGQLGGFFHLDAAARRRAMACRGAGNQLGHGLQLGTARFLGAFLPDPEQAPAVVVDYVAEQLGLDPDDLKGYGTREARWDHQDQIRRAYGYSDFDAWQWFALARWLYVRCRLGNERPIVLFDHATARLVEAKVLLPGVSTLERLVAAVRERAETRLWRQLSGVPDDAEREHLLGLLTVPEGSRVTGLDRLRRAPTSFHAKGLIGAIDRYIELDGYRGPDWEVRMRTIPPGRIAELVRYAKAVRAAAVADLTPDRKIATLVAFAASMPTVAADEALEVFDLLMDDLARAAAAGVVRERARTLRDLDAAALLLAQAWRAVTGAAEVPGGDIRAALRALDVQLVHAATRTVADLAVAPDDGFAAALAEKYLTIIRFLPKLLTAFDFAANPAGRPVLDAAPFVLALRKRRNPIGPDALPPGVLTEAWRRRVVGPDGVDKRAFTVAYTEALREKLRRHDIYVNGLRRFGDPNARLIDPEAWKTTKATACADLGLSSEPGPDLDTWGDSLHQAYQTLSDGLADNPAVRIEDRGGRDRLVLTGLDKLDEPESLTWLDAEVAARLPSVDLPEMLMEVHGWVPYLDDFTNVSDSNARGRDMHVSVAAVLCAEATNTGLKPVINEGREALRRGRLFWVEQNYVRDECCSRATARMVAFHAAQPIVANWGGGELASADGLRFVTPIRTINSRPNPKYFGPGARRGVTFYNFLFDMYVGFNGIIVPGTQRDSLYILDGLLEQDSGIRPLEVTADTAGASEIVFGLFRIMGYRFSPRLADAGSAKLYRIDSEADYGELNNLTRDKIRIDLIKKSWDDILRLAASLRTGTVKASEMLRVLTPGGRPTALGRAIMEIGRLDRSTFLAMYFNDAIFRRKVNRQLNRQESRHQLARRIYHGQKGELRKKYREGQEDQLGALGLVLNVVVLWNTVYIQKIIAEPRAEGHHIRDEDIARISPLDFAHINFHGRYSFALPAEVTAGALRPTPRPTVTRTVR